MRFMIFGRIKEMLRDQRAMTAFSQAIEIRQRLFQRQFSKALCLDKYDLIADHIVLYRDDAFTHPIAYLRVISQRTCQEFDLPNPVLPSVSHSKVHLDAYLEFEKVAKIPVNMGYLCLEQGFHRELRGIKIIDLMTWVGYQACGHAPEDISFCGTANSKFNQTAWLEKMGGLTAGIPQFLHPVIPDPHDLILIPQLRPEYWAEQKLKYGVHLSNAVWLKPAASVAEKSDIAA